VKNVDLELVAAGGVPLTPEEAEAIRKVIAIAQRHRAHVLWRIKLRVLWGLARPSYAVRVGLFLPFLAWLLERATDLPTATATEGSEL
jgi:hypothetical protein